jgi:hypothetical protein
VVGRELPNLRPNGEDHRGAGGGKLMGMLRITALGAVTQESKSWIRKGTARIHTALGWPCGGALGLLAILFNLQGQTWVIGTAVRSFADSLLIRKTMMGGILPQTRVTVTTTTTTIAKIAKTVTSLICQVSARRRERRCWFNRQWSESTTLKPLVRLPFILKRRRSKPLHSGESE